MFSTKQINDNLFAGVARTTVLRRLRLLEKKKYIFRLSCLETKENLWGMTQKAANILGVQLSKRYWNQNLMDHDFKLLCLRLKLEEIGIAKSWTPEHEIKSLLFKKYRVQQVYQKLVPDGIMVVDTIIKRQAVAIELELTLKNKARLKDILKRYQSKKDLNVVWYIVANSAIKNTLLAVWNEVYSKEDQLKLFISYYDEVMKNPTEAILYASHGKIKMFDLWMKKGAQATAHTVSTLGLNEKIKIEELNSNDPATYQLASQS
jgi:DNA-binding Lrp family transcriptional regulator